MGGGYIAEVRVGAAFADDAAPEVTYAYGDHLGSVTVVADDTGAWVNREEYTPYGETSFGSFARKRYRFTGRPRDAESGLSYHGARYYAPHLGRWTACDPAGLADGANVYIYARNNPMWLVDPTGLAGETPNQVNLNDTIEYSQKVENRGALGHNVQKDHVIAQEKINMIRRDPSGKVHHNPKKDLAVVVETGKAAGGKPAKPHTQKTYHHPQADVKEIKRLKQSGIGHITTDIVEPSRQAALGSGYKPESVDTGVWD